SAWHSGTGRVDWVSLARTADYLRGRARPGELTCVSQPAVGIYKETELTPASRYAYVDVVLYYFLPDHQGAVMEDLTRSGQRFLLTDVETAHLPAVDFALLPPDGEQPVPYDGLTARRHDFPWSAPIVFRAGRYVVHQVRAPGTGGQ